MPRLSSIAVLLILIAPGLLTGQHALNGTVIDADGSTLPSVQVVLYEAATIRGYTLTDEAGNFTLHSAAGNLDSAFLELRFLGYATQRHPLNQLPTDGRYTLAEGGIELTEVKISEEALPLSRRDDTLVYAAAKYRDGSERKVEDLLRRLPGVEVSDEGEISVGGESINRILIEGQDAFGHNYQLASKNINADFVEAVSVIDHYSDDKLTDDLTGNQELVLNLELTEDRRNVLFGEAQLAAGNRGTTDKDLNAFLLSPERTAVLFGQANTIGRMPSSGMDLRFKTGNDQNPQSLASPTNPLLQPTLGRRPPAVETEQYLDNTALATAGSVLIQPNDSFRSRTIASVDYQTARLQNVEHSTRVSALGPLTLDQIDRFSENEANFWIDSDNRLTVGNNQRVDLRFLARRQNRADAADLTSALDDRPADLISAELDGRLETYGGHIGYTLRSGAKTALRFGYRIDHETHDQQAAYRSERFADWFDLSDTPLQTARRGETRHDLYGEWLHHPGRWNLHLRAGYRRVSGDLSAELGEAASHLTYSFAENYLSANVRRPLGKFETRVGLTGALTRLRYDRAADGGGRSGPLLNAFAEVAYPVNKRTRIMVGGRSDQHLPSARELLMGPYLSDYQTLTRGLAAPYLQHRRRLYINYRYQNLFRQFSYRVGLDHTDTPNGLGSEVAVEGPFVIRSLVGGAPSSSTRLAGQIAKFVKALAGNLRLDAQLIQLVTQLDIGLASGANRYRIYQGTAAYQGSLSRRLKWSLRYTHRLVTNTIGGQGTEGVPVGVETGIWQTVGTYRPVDDLYLEARGRLYQWYGGLQTPPVLLLGLGGRYELSDRWTVTLNAYNLLGQDQIAQISANSFLVSERIFDLRGRTVLAGVNYTF